jgi:hypothetical protein
MIIAMMLKRHFESLQTQLQIHSLLIVIHCNNCCNYNMIKITFSITIFSIHDYNTQNLQLQSEFTSTIFSIYDYSMIFIIHDYVGSYMTQDRRSGFFNTCCIGGAPGVGVEPTPHGLAAAVHQGSCRENDKWHRRDNQQCCTMETPYKQLNKYARHMKIWTIHMRQIMQYLVEECNTIRC